MWNQPDIIRHHTIHDTTTKWKAKRKGKQSNMTGKHRRVVLPPAPAAPERQRLVRDARCARVSSASSAPTPAAGAFPLVRCRHQSGPPGARCPELTQGVPQAVVHRCLSRDNTCEPCSPTVRGVLRQFARDPCHACHLTRGQQFSCTTVKVLETTARGPITKREHKKTGGEIRREAISEQVLS